MIIKMTRRFAIIIIIIKYIKIQITYWNTDIFKKLNLNFLTNLFNIK